MIEKNDSIFLYKKMSKIPEKISKIVYTEKIKTKNMKFKMAGTGFYNHQIELNRMFYSTIEIIIIKENCNWITSKMTATQGINLFDDIIDNHQFIVEENEILSCISSCDSGLINGHWDFYKNNGKNYDKVSLAGLIIEENEKLKSQLSKIVDMVDCLI